jgi:DUF4097 and DUF4098 domain-containing protein YvlB
MKKFIVAMIAVFGVIVLGLIILMVTIISSGQISVSSPRSFAGVELVNTTSLSLEGVDSLVLDYSSDNIRFYESDSSELILKEYMNITPKEQELTQIRQSGSTLRLQGGDRNWRNWVFQNYNGYVEVYLPTGYNKSIKAVTSSGDIESELSLQLSDLSVSCSSGNIQFEEVIADQINAATSSGNIKFNRAEGDRSFASSSGNIQILGGDGDTNVSSTSGNITIKANTGELKAGASSGDIAIEAVIGSKEIDTTSGRIRLSECKGFTEATASSGDIIITELGGAGRFESTSGNIKVSFTRELSESREDIVASASSGNIVFTLPSGLSFDFVAKTSSGDIKTFFDDSLSFDKHGNTAKGSIGANPSFQMELSTTSGNITVAD